MSRISQYSSSGPCCASGAQKENRFDFFKRLYCLKKTRCVCIVAIESAFMLYNRIDRSYLLGKTIYCITRLKGFFFVGYGNIGTL